MMMIIIPIMAYAGAVLLVQLNQQMGWLPVPYELSQTITLPTLGAIPFLFANLLTALLLSLAGFAILTLFYSLIYKFFGPPQYGQLDADPREVRRPVKRRKY